MNGASYPILRIFASWPGEANLERSLEWKEERRGTPARNSHAGSVEDGDGHPLARLRLDKFNKVGRRPDALWLKGDTEGKLVGYSKRAREEEEEEEDDSVPPRLRKSARIALLLGTHSENSLPILEDNNSGSSSP